MYLWPSSSYGQLWESKQREQKKKKGKMFVIKYRACDGFAWVRKINKLFALSFSRPCHSVRRYTMKIDIYKNVRR